MVNYDPPPPYSWEEWDNLHRFRREEHRLALEAWQQCPWWRLFERHTLKQKLRHARNLYLQVIHLYRRYPTRFGRW